MSKQNGGNHHEPDNVLICWCIMRQLELDNPEQIGDVMGITAHHARLLIDETRGRFHRSEDVPFPELQEEGD